MTFYVKVGDVPPKRHIWHRDASGAAMVEELMGEEGFSGASSLLYHRHSPSALVGVEAVTVERDPLTANDPLLPWHIRGGGEPEGDLVRGRRVLFGNSQLSICRADAAHSSGLYRNAAGDELVYIQSGRARLESSFGVLDVSAGDYVVLPASTTHRWVQEEPVSAIVVEATGHVSIPERYLTRVGQLREGAPLSERDIRTPTEPLTATEAGPAPVLVRTRSGWASHCHAHHPFDVAGWDGYVYPYAFSIRDFEPLSGRIHQPPPVHQTFAGPGFVVCSFVPRPFEFDPRSVKVPYHHANVDSDEVLFYSSGNFSSRKGSGVGAGSWTMHPAGFVHGPQPGSAAAVAGETRTEETAVMIDTFAPLMVSSYAREYSDENYPWSWARNG